MQPAVDRLRSSSSSSSLDSADDITWQEFVALSSDSEDEQDDVDGALDDEDVVDFVAAVQEPDRKRQKMGSGVGETLTRLWMKELQHKYMDVEYVRVFCGTWNVNGQEPSNDVREWLTAQDDRLPDIYAIGFQELDLSLSTYFVSDSSLEDEWIRGVTTALSQKADYKLVNHCRLVGIMLLVFVRTELYNAVSDVAVQSVGTGLLRWMGNKGGVGVRLKLHNTTICFVCSHLAAHTEDVDGRNEDYSQIVSKMTFSRVEITDHDAVFWFGDLNYRLDNIDNDECKDKISRGQLDDLWRTNDQLRREMSEEDGAFSEFNEGRITFNPTFKYDPGTDDWDSSSKQRTPAWCDRVLWLGKNIRLLSYQSHPSLQLSDHKPVSAVFELGVKVMKPQVEKQVHDEVSNVVIHRSHNRDSLPKLSVDSTDIHFNSVRFMELKRRPITLTNTGKVPLYFEFVSQETASHDFKPWLTVLPSRGFISIRGETRVRVEMFVDGHTAARLNAGRDQLRDNLIIRIQGGQDVSISVTGDYVSSRFFASHVDNLARGQRSSAVRTTTAMASTPSLSTEFQLLQASSCPVAIATLSASQSCAMTTDNAVDGVMTEVDQQASTSGRAGVPVEIRWLVEFLIEHALDKEKLFQLSGLQCELRLILECLDNGTPDKLPRSVHSVVEALMTLLDSSEEPVIPADFYQRCIDARDDHTLSRQVISTIPEYNKNLFEYICDFCQTLLRHSDKNHLNASFLATVFGSLLLRSPAEHGRPSADEEHKRAQFVRHFIDIAG